MLPSVLLLLAAAGSASAHFKLVYPPWRSNSLTNDAYSQYDYPCAGVPATSNRTDWPLTGGSLRVDLTHTASYLFLNLGLGENATNFNYSLTPPTFWNETGKGTLCVPEITLPSDLPIADGQAASLQIVTVTHAGQALYNCADITFRSGTLTAFGGENCTSSEGDSYKVVEGDDDDDDDDDDDRSSSNSTTTSSGGAAASSTAATTSGAAPGTKTGVAPAWMAAAAMAAAFVWGMGM